MGTCPNTPHNLCTGEVMSKVESKTGVRSGCVYRHFKNGRDYLIMGFVINSTNGPGNGEVMVRYRRVGGECEFVRTETEFTEIVEHGDIVGNFFRARFEFIREAIHSDYLVQE